MNKIKNPNTYFFLFWIGLQLFFNWTEYINFGPFGMHQGAQADRASVAFNYFNASMNFFEPRVMESRSFNGITGLEFPIIQYIAAIFYKIFGFHDFIYRTIMGIIVFGGCFSVWKITEFFIQKTTHRYLIFTLWYSSPILVFYSFNYIPDIAAMSFTLMAWHQFFKYYFGITPKHSINKYLLFTTFAGLLKVTFLISHLSILALLLLQKTQPDSFRVKLILKPITILKFFIPFIFIAAWYGYANHLTVTNWNFHFLQKMNPAKTFADFIENTRFAFDTWSSRIYLTTALMAMATFYVASLIKYHQNLDILGWISVFLFGGFFAIFILFNGQFKHHDYYFMALFPFAFFAILWLYQIHIGNKHVFTGIFAIASIIGLWAIPFYNAFHSKQILRRTFTKQDYYCQNVIDNIEDYSAVKLFLDNQLNSQSKEIWTAFDNSPNVSLYLLKRQGIRIADDFTPELIEGIWERKNNDSKEIQPLIVLNNTQHWNQLPLKHVKIDPKPLFSHGSLGVYKMNYIY